MRSRSNGLGLIALLSACDAFVTPTRKAPLTTARRFEASDEPDRDVGVIGASALVAGNMIGGGILAMPTVCQGAGFLPSTALLAVLWAANVGCGLLLGEVSAAAIRDGEDDVSLRSLSAAALGETGAAATSAVFAATNLLLMGAYIAQGGDTLFAGLGETLGFAAPRLAYALVVAAAIVALPAAELDSANSALVGVMAVALAGLVGVAAPHVDGAALLTMPVVDAPALAGAAPVLVGALVFQQIVPVLAKRLDGDSERLRAAIVFGSAAPLVAYVAFVGSVLGRAGAGAPSGPGALLDAAAGLPEDVAGPAGAALACFSVAAITTSLAGSALSQIEELRGVSPNSEAAAAADAPAALAWTFLPPLALALSGRDVFLPLLSMTGGIANPFLFGILPCFLAWRHRYDDAADDSPADPLELLPGGRPSIATLGSGSAMFVVSAGLSDAAHAAADAAGGLL